MLRLAWKGPPRLRSAEVDNVISYALHFFRNTVRPARLMSRPELLPDQEIVRAVLWGHPRNPRAEVGPLKGPQCRFDSDRGYWLAIMPQLVNAVPGGPAGSKIN